MKAAQARVLLTGAGGGIGQAVADTLAGAGAALMLAGRSPARLSAQARALKQRMPGAQVDWHEADLQHAPSIASLALQAETWNCNVVIHCAGVAEFGRFEETGTAAMSRVLNTNLLAPMMLTQSLLPHLRGQAVALFREEVAKGMSQAAKEMQNANLDTSVILFFAANFGSQSSDLLVGRR